MGFFLDPTPAISAAVDPRSGHSPVSRRSHTMVARYSWKTRGAETAGQIGRCQFRPRLCDADSANERAEPIFLMGEYVFDLGVD